MKHQPGSCGHLPHEALFLIAVVFSYYFSDTTYEGKAVVKVCILGALTISATGMVLGQRWSDGAHGTSDDGVLVAHADIFCLSFHVGRPCKLLLLKCRLM